MTNQDSANVVSTMNRVGLQDSAGTYPPCQRRSRVYCFAVRQVARRSAPTTRHPHPCPYRMEIWYRIGGGTPVRVSEREA